MTPQEQTAFIANELRRGNALQPPPTPPQMPPLPGADLMQGDPEANINFAGALASPAKAIVNALKRDSANRAQLGREVQAGTGRKVVGGPGGLDAVMAAGVPLIARALKAESAAPSGIRAYHGSPHDFPAERLVRMPSGKNEYIVGAPDTLPPLPSGAEVVKDFPLGRMRMDKIGTGEGAQAYGHGLYAAEAEAVGKGYRDRLSGQIIPGASTGSWKYDVAGVAPPKGIVGHKALDTSLDMQGIMSYMDMAKTGQISHESAQRSIDYLKSQVERRVQQFRAEDAKGWMTGSAGEDMRALANFWDKTLRNAKPADIELARPGKMYELNIRAKPEEFLDWDKPLFKQGDIGKAAGQVAEKTGGPSFVYNSSMGLANAPHIIKNPTFSRAAADAGIPGIRYLDQGSRGTAGGQLQAIEKTPEGYKARIFTPNRGGTQFADPTNIHTWSPPFKTEAEAAKWAADKINAGTNNYVLFRDDIIDILRKYGIPGAGVAGAGALAAGSDPAQAASVRPEDIAKALREGP